MKRIIILLLALLVLCGCSQSHTSNISDPDTVLIKTADGKTYTKGEAYEAAKKFDISESLNDSLINKICELEGIDSSELVAKAEEEIATAEAEGYSYYITYYYGSNEAYIENYVSYALLNKLKTNYVSLDLNKYKEEYGPVKAEVVYFDNEESAAKVVEDSKTSNATFAFICNDNGYGSEVYSSVYTNNDTTLPTEVVDYIKGADIGVSDVITVEDVSTDSEGNSTTSTSYYVVNLISKDIAEFTEDFVTTISSDIDSDEVISYYLNVYPIEVYDQDIYDILSEKYEAVK